ncbi:bifunctional metallophosphatase/5'-nucleotidase [Corynebacterium sp.]|uniref:bifunctional metallophosphatase/5'-nucleotidase n=1 Tax=Corynebacterium sp. TaxID=1720 RepID=UPI003735D930
MFKFRRVGRLIAATTTSALALSTVVVAGAQEDNLVTISISNFTDFHGHLEDGVAARAGDIARWEANPGSGARPTYDGVELGAANLAALMDYVNQDAAHGLKTTSGDNVGGSAFISSIANDEPTMDALNAMGIDVNAAGNHEFDKGHEDLSGRLVERHDSEILAANVYYNDGSRFLEPSKVYDFDGVKLGVVGTTSNATPKKVSPKMVEGINFTDASTEANAEAKRLKDEGLADIVVVLQHDPAEVDGPKMDPEYVDFLFGGDSHLTQLDNDAPVPYAQSWEYGKLVTDLDITYNKATGEIEEINAQQYGAPEFVQLQAEGVIEPNAEVAAIVDKAAAEAEVLGEQEVAQLDESFYRGSEPGRSAGSNRGVESTANNMLAESNLQAMDAFLGGGMIDLGLMNAGGVRSDLEAGAVTVEEAYTMQPFGNELSYATLSGQAIIDALERQWQPGSGRPRLSLGVSDNVNYVYNPEAEQGQRIQHVTINGAPLDPAKDYTVATSTFLFEGGDSFINPDDVRDQVNVGYMDITAFMDYLASGQAAVRSGQAEVGVVLPEGGLKAGEKNTIQLSSLNYSTEGEPMAQTVTLKIGDTEVTADISNETTEADAGFGEIGRATVEIDLPAEAAGDQTLSVTTDAGTDISMPVTVADADGSTPDPAPAPSQDTPGSAGSLSSNPIMGLILGLAAALGLGGLIALLFPNQIDSALANFF